MARLHLMEIEDQPWCPRVLRDAATAYLKKSMEVTGHIKLLAPKIAEALHRSGSDEILDLCSGGGGPVVDLLDGLAEQGIEVRVQLTDYFPNLPALEAAASAHPRVNFVREPVDATDVPRRLSGVRTLFNAFHHFRPTDARRILQSAVDARRAIGVFEVVSRTPAALVGMLFSPVAVWILMPLVRPVRWSWLLFTYLIPLVPLVVIFDGIVSCLRVYSVEELRALLEDVDASAYRWDVGQIPLGRAPASATYLIGYPEAG